MLDGEFFVLHSFLLNIIDITYFVNGSIFRFLLNIIDITYFVNGSIFRFFLRC